MDMWSLLLFSKTNTRLTTKIERLERQLEESREREVDIRLKRSQTSDIRFVILFFFFFFFEKKLRYLSSTPRESNQEVLKVVSVVKIGEKKNIDVYPVPLMNDFPFILVYFWTALVLCIYHISLFVDIALIFKLEVCRVSIEWLSVFLLKKYDILFYPFYYSFQIIWLSLTLLST